MISPFCPKCKYKITTGSVCPVCNTNLSSPMVKEEKPKVPELDTRMYAVEFGLRPKMDNINKKKKKVNLTLIMFMIILLTIIALIIYIISLI